MPGLPFPAGRPGEERGGSPIRWRAFTGARLNGLRSDRSSGVQETGVGRGARQGGPTMRWRRCRDSAYIGRKLSDCGADMDLVPLRKPRLMDFDFDRFKRLFHYVVWKAGDRPNFGATKLYKVLWFADARTYVLTGKPISGETYIRKEHGPMPKHAVRARESLEGEGAIAFTPQRGKFDNSRFHALTRPQMSGFSATDLQTVDWWIGYVDGAHTAGSVSDLSHDYGWQIAEMDEELPLYSVLAERIRDLNDDEREEARKRAKELGLA